jgi:hypothetical protein
MKKLFPSFTTRTAQKKRAGHPKKLRDPREKGKMSTLPNVATNRFWENLTNAQRQGGYFGRPEELLQIIITE